MDPITKASKERTKHFIVPTESSFSGKEVVLYVHMFISKTAKTMYNVAIKVSHKLL